MDLRELNFGVGRETEFGLVIGQLIDWQVKGDWI